jgi:thiosulfate/3-mercaptopyruvate sulfurtransferase
MKSVLLVVVAALSTAAPVRGQALAPAQNADVLVSTRWLADHLNDPGLVIFHVGNDANSAQGHIPGARLMPLASYAPERNGLSTELPEPAAFDELLEAAGVTNNSRIIVYSATNPPQLAARLYVTLDHFGLSSRTSLLDGGLVTWRAENRTVATDPTSAATRGSVELRTRAGLVVDYTYVQQRLADGASTVMDARDTPFWTGAQQNQQRAARPGRVPGARNVPFNTLVSAESGKLLGVDQLRSLFEQAGVASGRPLVVYCHVGQQASLLFVAARLLGHEVRLYDGSYEDWSKRAELEVQTGGGPER